MSGRDPFKILGIKEGYAVTVYNHPFDLNNMVKSEDKRNRKGFPLKHKVVLILSIVALAAVAIVSSHVHRDQLAKSAAVQVEDSRVAAAQAQAASVREVTYSNYIQGLQAQCAKDWQSYDAAKVKPAVPVCSLKVVEQ